jgi:leucyl-tRNA synthetase
LVIRIPTKSKKGKAVKATKKIVKTVKNKKVARPEKKQPRQAQEERVIDYQKLDAKWQKRWKDGKSFEAEPGKRKKFFVNVPYPYVNGAPHIGAGFTFIRGDVYARFKRMQGFNVLFAQGFHATGEPILGVVKRIREGDQSQIAALKLYGIGEDVIQEFADRGPEFVAKYWKAKWIEALTAAGFSVDWRRTFITTPMTPTYSRFIEWQYNTLKKKGYVVQGTHPVVWCPNCKSPTGDHDRLEGVGESAVEYTILKFRMANGEVLPCGTLRPETIYGVSNIWVNPDAEYVRAKVDGEVWILSERATVKLEDQLKKIEIIGRLKGAEIVGRTVKNPVTGDNLPILPASFCDTEMATGVVMSVPAHAPYDWIALEDLRKDFPTLKKYRIDMAIHDVRPITIIRSEGMGDQPAKEMADRFGAKSQKDVDALEKATEQLYKKEFHTGVCNERCGPHAGQKVTEVKDKLIAEFRQKGIADSFHETTATVQCRCKTRCHIKILENQWFLKFSDKAWKAKVNECIDRMKFYPEEARQQFQNTVSWLNDKACTRHSGLGTPLPWDKTWIVETLSDSTIYMAYYTLANTINENKVEPKNLPDEAFDYILLGKGDLSALVKTTGLKKDVLQRLREEFTYFYPSDLRNSGKDLIQNHLTYYLFHHVAIWENDPSKWPQAIGANGYVNVKGEKMSKSKGNFIPLADLVKKFGADLVRINIVASNENMDDADWREESIGTYDSRLRYLFELVPQLKNAKVTQVRPIDLWMQSRMHESIKQSEDHYDHMRFRSATQHSMFALTSDIKWYVERVGGVSNCNKAILSSAVEALVKMVAPLVPHSSEELWSKMGNKSLVSLESWPKFDQSKIDKNALQMEEMYKKTLEDVKAVRALAEDKTKAMPTKLFLYFVTDKEMDMFKQSIEHLKKEGFVEVSLFKSQDEKAYDPQMKKGRAKFGKPGIWME